MGEEWKSEKLALTGILFIFSLVVTGVLFVNHFQAPSILMGAIVCLSFFPVTIAKMEMLSDKVYFLLALLTSASLTVILPLRGTIIGRDGPLELHTLREILTTGSWDPTYFEPVGPLLYNPLVAMLTSITGLELVPLFLAFSASLQIIIVTGSYIFFNQHFSKPIPFLLAALIAYQSTMLRAGLGSIRETLGILFFVFIITLIISFREENSWFHTIFLISMSGHYYAGGVFLVGFFGIALLYYIVPHLRGESMYDTTVEIVGWCAISLIASLLWLIEVGGALHVFVHLERLTFSIEELTETFIFSSGSAEASSDAGMSLADIFSYAVIGGTLGLMCIGSSILLIRRYMSSLTLTAMIFSSLFLMVMAVTTPIVSDSTVGVFRIYQYVIILLAFGLPVIIYFGTELTNRFSISSNCKRYAIIAVALLIGMQLIIFSGIPYQLEDDGTEMVWFDENGEQSDLWKVEEQEKTQTNFLTKYGTPSLMIHGDRYVEHRTLPYITRDYAGVNRYFFAGNRWEGAEKGYLYLRSQNIEKGMIAPQGTEYSEFEPIEGREYVTRSGVIYTTGSTELRRYDQN